MTRIVLKRQRGVSFVEVAIASVVLSGCAVLLWGVIDRQAKVVRSVQSFTLVDRADDALLAYGYLHGRLPCPAPLTTGAELCDGKATGFLPYLTLGLPEPDAGRIRYRVSMVAPSPVIGSAYQVVVTQPVGAFKDPAATAVPLAVLNPNGHEPLFDLCRALGAPAVGREMAYALTLDPGSAKTASANAVTPMTAQAVEHTVGRSQFAARLHCGALAVAGRAQFDAALAADTMAHAMGDIHHQFELIKFTYVADTLNGAFFLGNSIYSLKRAVTKTTAAMAAMQASDGADAKALTLSRVNMAKAGIYTAAMASNYARFLTNEGLAELRERTLEELKIATGKSAADIKARALLGSSSAFFLEDKWSKPAP